MGWGAAATLGWSRSDPMTVQSCLPTRQVGRDNSARCGVPIITCDRVKTCARCSVRSFIRSTHEQDIHRVAWVEILAFCMAALRVERILVCVRQRQLRVDYRPSGVAGTNPSALRAFHPAGSRGLGTVHEYLWPIR